MQKIVLNIKHWDILSRFVKNIDKHLLHIVFLWYNAFGQHMPSFYNIGKAIIRAHQLQWPFISILRFTLQLINELSTTHKQLFPLLLNGYIHFRIASNVIMFTICKQEILIWNCAVTIWFLLPVLICFTEMRFILRINSQIGTSLF